MRRSKLHCSLFLPFTLSVIACLFTQQLAIGQKGSNAPGGGMGVGGMGSGGMSSGGMGSSDMGMGGRGGMSGPAMGTSGPGMGMGSGPAQTNAEKEAAAFRDRCLLLTTKFVHNGVEFQSKTGIGCVIATPQGQRILAMPLSLIEPIEIDQERANKKLAIPSSLLLAAKIGSDRKCRERLEAFALQVADMPPSIETTDFAFESERRIFRALSARTEIAFSRTPLSNVMKFFQETFGIPIVVDERLLEMDAPITLELPEVTFRSALNLILEPLDLTYAIENEVLRITGKRAAGNRGVDTKGKPNFTGSNPRGVVGFSSSGGSDSGMGGGGRDCFAHDSVRWYETFQAAQRANQTAMGGGGMGGMGGGGMGMGSMGGGMGSMGGGMGGMGGARREYAAIQGPLAVHENTDLGIAFISLPGDFLSIPIPTRVDLGQVQSVMLDDWRSMVELNASRPTSLLEGSPVVGETGKPVGLFIREKVVSFPQLFEALMRVDAKSLGYWGAESANIESQVVEGLPELIPAELKAQIEIAATLQGKDKDKAMKDLKSQLSTQVADRNRFAERKIESLQTKLAAITRLSNEMKKKDMEEVNKLLPKELALKIYEKAESDQILEDDPFK